MARKSKAQSAPDAERRLRRANRWKVVRTALQLTVLAVVIAYAVRSIIRERSAPSSVTPAITAGAGGGNRFIALSYPGLTRSTRLDSKIVNEDAFAEQIRALVNSGYVAITQNDIVNYYFSYGSLPPKAVFLIFEDGIRDTPRLAQEVLNAYNLTATICTYANNLNDTASKFITAEGIKSLLSGGRWEMGTNGFRLSYINVFDRYGNYFGNLNGNEFGMISGYLKRDYNHYLMDFERDADRLRTENEAELRTRIQADYDQMQAAYAAGVGRVPGLYILMHSNTGAFATDPIASDANKTGLTNLFAMNFNRQGTCLNTLDSSIYDLSRLQVQSYFSTNHLLMRIRDDTGDAVAFVTGDEEEAKNWYLDGGVAQYKGDEIILTTEPEGESRITLKTQLLSDLDMTVTLRGNLVGCQQINLRTDRDLQTGIQVALEKNELVIRDLNQGGTELFRRNLFELDGGPFISEQEDEHNGLVALQNAIIQYDGDTARVAEAQEKLLELEATPVVTLADGGTPYYPELDSSDRVERKLRIRLAGPRLSVWVDDKIVAEQISVSGTQLGSLSFGAKVYADSSEYSRRLLHDDVYDAVFVEPVVYDAANPPKVLYTYAMTQKQTINATITGWFDGLINFFLDNF